jgi:nitrite reductase/ring-hydroxylating ferredoxin subunit
MWIALALSRDVPKGSTRAVILRGREFVIWRSESGAIQIWEDRCPHRGMRLSFGFVRGEALNCLYHGWQYGTSGSCQKIPAHPDLAVPPTIRANAYPTAESGGFIMVSLDPEPEASPLLPSGRPIVSLAIATPPETLSDLVDGTPLDNVDGVSGMFDEASINRTWHMVSPRKLMLHAVAIDTAAVETHVLRQLHRLRADAEEGVAA